MLSDSEPKKFPTYETVVKSLITIRNAIQEENKRLKGPYSVSNDQIMKFLEVAFNTIYANALMIQSLQTSIINMKLKQTVDTLKEQNQDEE